MARRSPDRRTLVREALGPPAIARPVLAAAVHDPAPDGPPPTDADWTRWVGTAQEQRLATMTLSAMRLRRVEPPPTVADALRAAAIDETTVSLASERSALATISLLTDVGLRPILLKGATIAARHYPHPEDRPTRDVDLLLPESELPHAWDTLRSLGHLPPHPGMDPAWVSQYTKGRTLIGPNGTEVDLHRTLTVLPFGLLIDLEALHDCLVPANVGGRTVWALSDEATFFHVCLHAALTHRPGVLAHLDVALVSRSDLDAEAVRRLVGAGPLTSVVRAAVAETELVAPVAPAIRDLVASLPASPAGDRLLDWHRRRHRSFVSSLVRSIPLVGGPVDRIKYGASVGIGLARMAAGRNGEQLRRPSDA